MSIRRLHTKLMTAISKFGSAVDKMYTKHLAEETAQKDKTSAEIDWDLGVIILDGVCSHIKEKSKLKGKPKLKEDQ